MKIKTQLFVMIVTMLVAGWSSHALADKYTDTIDVFKKSEAVQPFFKNAYGYAVFPTIGKAGIGIGGSYGTGQVYQGGTVTVVAVDPADARVLLAGTHGGIFRSQDGGKNWFRVALELSGDEITAICPSPSRSITPGRKLWVMTSAATMSRLTSARSSAS